MPQRRDGGQQHAGRGAHGPRRRPRARALRALAEDVHLPAVLRRGRLRARHHEASATTEIGVVTQKGAARPGAVRARVVGRDPARVQRLLRHALSAAQARQHRRARAAASSSAPWRTGARSSASSTSCSSIPSISTRGGPAGHLLRRRARDLAPVVRRPGHHGLVGRPVAERGVRVLDGRAHHGEAAPGVEHRARRR